MSSRLLAPLLLAVLATACAENARPSRVGVDHVTPMQEQSGTTSASTQQNSPSPGSASFAEPAMRANASPATTSAQAGMQSPANPQAGTVLRDEHIAAILDAFYAGRIALAQQALWRASDPGVRHLAERLLKENVYARDHLSKLGLMRSYSDLSFGLLRKAGNDLMRLRALEGSDYDKSWTALTVVDSQNFTHLLTSTLIPAANQPMLDAQLRNLVPQFVADTRDEVRVNTNLSIPLPEQQQLQRDAAAAPTPTGARAQGGSPRVTPPPPAPAPAAPPVTPGGQKRDDPSILP